MARHNDFTTIRTEGALLPPDLLRRLRDNDKDLPGLTPDAYHLIGHTRLSEAISEAWNKLQGAWATFQDARTTIPEGTPGTATTRDRWLLPLFQVLDYGRLQTSTAREVNGKTYPISHAWTHVPIHLVGCNIDLDTRTAGVAGAARQSPHGLVQAYLNATDDSLWGVVSNGLKLRLLRDNHTLTRQAYLEFDLEAMLTGEVYPDFVLLYLTLHQSRLEADKPENTLLEQWTRAAQDQGTRALDRLRDGVQAALTTLGQGFLEHPANTTLRTDLTTGTLTPQGYYRQLLRVVYRFLVLFAAEDRDLLHPPTASEEAKRRYAYYSTRRLRDLADAIPGGRHPDQYHLLKRTWHWLGHDGAPDLAIPALGGFLFSPTATPHLDDAELTNRSVLGAIRNLAYTQVEHSRFPIDYRNMGAEELGSVYESLLELVPRLDPETGEFQLEVLGESERRSTGSYYTPTSLINVALDGALGPAIERAAGSENPEQALLRIRVLDPSAGSGHFLIGAGHRIARRLAQVRAGDDEPAVVTVRHALRDVISKCLYGVDLNDMAAELCKVALWLEALEPGRPLTFLDHHVKAGNSLVGVPPWIDATDLVSEGIPDEAYAGLEDDDREVVRATRMQNRRERAGEPPLFGREVGGVLRDLARRFSVIESTPDEDIATIRAKEDLYRKATSDAGAESARRVADAWVAAHFWPLRSGGPRPITSADLRDIDAGTSLSPDQESQMRRLAEEYRFLHWQYAFPSVIAAGGFDVVVGNPPYVDSEAMSRSAPRQRQFIAGAFQSTSGNWDMYVPFVERSVDVAQESGSVALVTPAKILASDYAAALQTMLLRSGLSEVHDFSDARPFRDADVSVAILVTHKQHGRATTRFVRYGSDLKATRDVEVTVESLRKLPTGFISAPLQATNPSVLRFLECPSRLKDIAKLGDGATTGEAYEIRKIVQESGSGSAHGHEFVRLANTGTIDPFRVLWGAREIRYLGFRGPRPVVPASGLGALSAKRLNQAMSPKVILAGLGKSLEAAYADAGVLCGKSSVMVLPSNDVCPYALTALLNAPCVTELYAALFGARGFGAGSMNIGARQLEQLPVPHIKYLLPYNDEVLVAALEAVDDQDLKRLLPRGLLSAIGRRLSRDGAHDDDVEADVSAGQLEHLDNVVHWAFELTLDMSGEAA